MKFCDKLILIGVLIIIIAVLHYGLPLINKLLDGQVDNKAKDHTVLASTVYDKLQEINGNVLTIKSKLNGIS